MEGENLVTSAKSTGFGLAELATVFDNLQPDAVVTVADRFETLATAISASYLNIPLVHVQGGEVTGSIDEKVRHAVTKLADLHFVSTEKSAERVIRMGEQPERVFVTGCPSIDVVKRALSSPAIPRTRLFDEYGGVGESLDLSKGYIVVLQHPVTTEHAQSRRHVAETLHAVVDSGLAAIWFWPNVDAGSDGTSRGIRAFREANTLPRIHFFKNLPPEDFLRLVNDSLCIVGNSSVGIRECSHMGVPTINIGSRQQGRERGANTIDVTYDRSTILAAIQRAVKGGRCKPDPLYGDGNSGPRIADLLAETPFSIEKRLAY
jgi:UDP-hydrolysing UDP-N-acetyl-D-glucosamine 2-epimerase